jgi:hypothetical protein
MRGALLSLPILAVALVPAPRPVQGCAPAPRQGEYVGVNAEEAVILYDAATKTEHFVRRADFRTDAKDFGFLVPTPTKPDLGETKADIFYALSSATAPRHVPSGKVHTIVQKRSRHGDGAAMPGSAVPPRPPEVLDEKKGVAGYDLVVLKAEDLDGLKKWLEERGYDARPALMDWLKWYVDNKWVITAFKVAKTPDSQHDRWAKAVRMSFPTDAPFYPYREPEDVRNQPAAASPRTLRVFYLGDARAEGKLGEAGSWPAKTVWANACPEYTLNSVVDGLGLAEKDAKALGGRPWHLTEFEDASSPRPGTHEVFFSKAKDQSAVERPVVYYDRYEYVYEDGSPVVGGVDADEERPRTPEEEERRTLWLIVGIVGGSVLLAGAGVLVALKVGARA